jgi:hypothetical protein
VTHAEAKEMIEDAVRFDYFTEPMKQLLRDFVANPDKHPKYIVVNSNPRIVDGKPTKNPRYLQTRPSLEKPMVNYIAETGARLRRGIDREAPVLYPVNGFLPGHRNNPPEDKVRALAVFNPIHHLPLPEAFMEFTSSMTGRSPSTTGAGSEGAMTKAPFNCLLPIADLNNALVAAALTGLAPFITAAGCVGPNFRVDHDISLLVPEIWCRMKKFERKPEWLIDNGYLEPIGEISHNGVKLPTGILGYRITRTFVNHFLGRIFTSPDVLFNEEMLKPELQDMEVFADGLDNMVVTHQRVAANYFEDGSYELACPPLRAMLEIMRDGAWDKLNDPTFRKLFEPEAIVGSDWYRARLDAKQQNDINRWAKLMAYMDTYPADYPALAEMRVRVKNGLDDAGSPGYRERLVGTIGREIAFYPSADK